MEDNYNYIAVIIIDLSISFSKSSYIGRLIQFSLVLVTMYALFNNTTTLVILDKIGMHNYIIMTTMHAAGKER